MKNNDRILTAKTIPDFFKTINDEYQLDLPTDFSGDSPVSKLLQTTIQEITQGNGEGALYTARGDPFNFETPNLKAWIIITIQTSTAA